MTEPKYPVGTRVLSYSGIRGKVTAYSPDANKWPYTVKYREGGTFKDELFGEWEIEALPEQTPTPGERLTALDLLNAEIDHMETKLTSLKVMRGLMEGWIDV